MTNDGHDGCWQEPADAAAACRRGVGVDRVDDSSCGSNINGSGI